MQPNRLRPRLESLESRLALSTAPTLPPSPATALVATAATANRFQGTIHGSIFLDRDTQLFQFASALGTIRPAGRVQAISSRFDPVARVGTLKSVRTVGSIVLVADGRTTETVVLVGPAGAQGRLVPGTFRFVATGTLPGVISGTATLTLPHGSPKANLPGRPFVLSFRAD
jgi:hypothetical protein